MEIAEDVAKKIIESCIEHGDPLPSGIKDKESITGSVDVKIPVSITA